MNKSPKAPDATLYIATGCTHCPIVLQGLSRLIEEGLIGRLEIINTVVHPDIAQEQGIRSVPWLQLGPFSLAGSYRPEELRQWAERAGSDQGLRDYLAELIENRRLDEAVQLAGKNGHVQALAAEMLGDLDTPLGVRIGIGALFEELAETGKLAAALPQLKQLLTAPEPQVRADAAYYIGLSRHPDARAWLTPLLKDGDAEVREITEEALQGLPSD